MNFLEKGKKKTMPQRILSERHQDMKDISIATTVALWNAMNDFCKRNKISQKAFAKSIEMSPQTLKSYADGKIGISVLNLIRILDRMDMLPSEFFESVGM